MAGLVSVFLLKWMLSRQLRELHLFSLNFLVLVTEDRVMGVEDDKWLRGHLITRKAPSCKGAEV